MKNLIIFNICIYVYEKYITNNYQLHVDDAVQI